MNSQSQIIILNSVQLSLFSVFLILLHILTFMNLEIEEFNIKNIKFQLDQNILNLNEDSANTFTLSETKLEILLI